MRTPELPVLRPPGRDFASLRFTRSGSDKVSTELPPTSCGPARERVGYQATEEVVALDVMPLNRTGKIDRVGLQRWRSTTSAERSGGVTTPVTPL